MLFRGFWNNGELPLKYIEGIGEQTFADGIQDGVVNPDFLLKNTSREQWTSLVVKISGGWPFAPLPFATFRSVLIGESGCWTPKDLVGHCTQLTSGIHEICNIWNK